MCDAMLPRGPDDCGVECFESDQASVSLGNRRLAIIDPSPLGHQPMVDDARGSAIAFNGMIYNFRELREELISRGEQFRSHCDTEVVLRAFRQFGPECVRRLRGMFAFAIWDGSRSELFLARDRLGIKPLYYFRSGGEVLIASQVKALLASGRVPLSLSVPAIEGFLATGAVDEPLTILDRVSSLPAGHCAVASKAGVDLWRWWDFPREPDLELDREDAGEELRSRLRESVGLHMVSDAPLGVFLSGGLDSSLVAALAVEQQADVRTLSVTFTEEEFSEEKYMRAVASRLGNRHVNVRLRPSELLAWSTEAFRSMDQPSYDGINVFAVSRAAAREGLKVALSGLGGDELFNGYGFLRRIGQLRSLRAIPSPLRAAAAAALGAGHAPRFRRASGWLRGELDPDDSYELLRRTFLPGELRRILPSSDGADAADRPKVGQGPDAPLQLAVAEMSSYMRNVLLRDTDAMSMSQSLEVRVPLLDHVLVEWCLRLSATTKGDSPKALLIEAARELVPESVLTRRKQGFVVPLDRWMRNELRSEVGSAFEDPPPALAEVLDAEAVRDVWARYLAGGRVLSSSEEWVRPWSLFALYRWVREAQAEARGDFL